MNIKPSKLPICYLRCLCPEPISQTEGYWIFSPNNGKPQDDIKAREKSKAIKVCICIWTQELTHSTHICAERSKQHQLSAIKQRMREWQQNTTDKERADYGGNKRKEEAKSEETSTRGKGENKGRRRKYSLMSTRKRRPLHPRGISTQYMSLEANQKTSGCCSEPITISVGDIRCTVGFKTWGERITDRRNNKDGSSWKSKLGIELISILLCEILCVVLRFHQLYLFLKSVYFSWPRYKLAVNTETPSTVQLEMLCTHQMFTSSWGTQHLVRV